MIFVIWALLTPVFMEKPFYPLFPHPPQHTKYLSDGPPQYLPCIFYIYRSIHYR